MEFEKLPWVLALSAAGSLAASWVVSVLTGRPLDASVVAMLSVVIAAAALVRERRGNRG